jgi:hypothetical protein
MMRKDLYKKFQAMSDADLESMLGNWNCTYDEFVQDVLDKLEEGFFQHDDVLHVMAKCILRLYQQHDADPDGDTVSFVTADRCVALNGKHR